MAKLGVSKIFVVVVLRGGGGGGDNPQGGQQLHKEIGIRQKLPPIALGLLPDA